MANDNNGRWVPWVLGIMVTATFSFTSWTAVKVIAVEKQTFSYQAGAIAERDAMRDKFDVHCGAQMIQDAKVETKLDKTYDAVIRIEQQIADLP